MENEPQTKTLEQLCDDARRLQKEYLEASDDHDRLFHEFDNVFTAGDTRQAQLHVFKAYRPQIEAIVKKMNAAFKQWESAMDEVQKKEREELGE